MDPATITTQFKLFARVAELYKADVMTLDARALENPVEALAQFVSGYAFERQGRSPSFGPLAGDVIRQLGRAPGFWKDQAAPVQVWDTFCEKLGQLPSPSGATAQGKANPKANPLCYQGYTYSTKQATRKTRQPSAVQFAQGLPDVEHNVLVWVKRKLEKDTVRDAHHALCGVNGIGPKIAAYFVREVAWCFNVAPDCDRALLQPVDVWVQRACAYMDPKSPRDPAAWMVQQAQRAQVSPEAANAGLWYLGTAVAGSAYRFFQVLDDPQQTEQLVEDHVARLVRQARAWK